MKEQVFDHAKVGNGGCKCNRKPKKGLRCSSQIAEKPRLDGKKAEKAVAFTKRTLPIPDAVNLIAKSTMLLPGP